MDFRELEYERLKQERAIRSEIRKLDEELAKVKKKFKKDKAGLVKKLGELEKELESGALQPGLFESAAAPDPKNVKLIGVDFASGEKKPRKGKKDTAEIHQLQHGRKNFRGLLDMFKRETNKIFGTH